MDFRRSTLACASFLALALGAIPLARAQTSILTIDGTQPSQSFGWTVLDIGDVSGDGIGDLAIGATDEGGHDGAVHVHSGANGGLICSAVGPPTGSYFGEYLAVLGDVDFDGHPDFAVGTGVQDGHVRLHSGSTGALLHDYSGADNGFGWSFDAIGDLDGDGAGDLVVGDPFVDFSGQDQGVVYTISGSTGAILHTMRAPPGVPSSRLGWSVSSVDDVDGDQVRDIVALNHSAPGVLVFSGATGAFLHAINGFPGTLGSTVEGGGDLDGDGRGDFIASDPFQDTVRVFSGSTGALVRFHSIPCGSEFFGGPIAILGDVDNDGRIDYAGGDRTGNRLRVFSGIDGQLIWDLFRRDFTCIAPTSDRNGDGRDDVVLGLGRAYVGGIQSVGRVMIAVDGIEPVVGTPSALGDGTGAPCPCGNTGTPGAGCAHGGGIGATAVAYGSTSITGSTFHLTTSGIPVPRLGLLFRGTAEVNGGLGLPAGDGLRGAGGTIKRLGFQQVCSDPFEWDPISNLPWTWNAGQTYLLQVWYRDNGGPCGTNFNMTNAVRFQTTP